jgi:hypothetical protein
MWKSTNIGGDKLEIHPSDSNYKAGVYYIGILAYKPNMNVFTVRADLAPASPLVDLQGEHFGKVHTWDYFKMTLEHPAQSRIEVTVDPGRGVLALFLSPSLYYPTEREHAWSVVSARQGWLDPDREEPIGVFSPDHYEDVDPFEKTMKKRFARCPNAKELETLQAREEAEEQGRQQIAGNGETLIFCNDTDEWKYANPICFIAVKNLTDAPVDYTIRCKELLEMSLLDPLAEEKYSLFRSLFENVEGSSVSQGERKRLGVSGKSEFTYGEVEFVHMIPVFELCEVQAGQVFWDLGCGAGKCLVAAAMLYPQLAASKGVEFLDRLYDLCKETVDRANERGVGAPISVVHGDMLQVDWSDADLIYTSSICFPQELIDGMYEKAKVLKKGAKIITLKNFPPNEEFEIKYNLRVKMTWGRTGVYVLEKVR